MRAPVDDSTSDPFMATDAGHAAPGGSVALPDAYIRLIAVASVCAPTSCEDREAFSGKTSGTGEDSAATVFVVVAEIALAGKIEPTRDETGPARKMLAVAARPNRMPRI